MIDQRTVQEIFERAIIDEVVGDYVSLKKRGSNLLGLCPFHNEKTPSFSVSPSKGIYKCFGCGKGGNAVNFIMEHEHLSYPEALRHLAKKYNIEIEEKELTPEERAAQSERESMLIVNDAASEFFHENLLSGSEGKRIGGSYLQERGLDGRTISGFALGYCPESREDGFTKWALDKGYRSEYLMSTGLSKEGRNGLYDFFHGRIMFPIRSISGRVLGFGGRTLKGDKEVAKYFNSPESTVYDKSKVLYGLYESKGAIVKEDLCYMVEGYMDVISMHQAGVENAVASSGTSLTKGQVRLIRRYTPNITLLYDSDAAGLKASMRGIEVLLEEGMKVRVVQLPEGQDPDSLSQSTGAEGFQKYLQEHSEDFFEFIVRVRLDKAGSDPISRSDAIQEAVKVLALLPDQIERNLKSQQLASQLGIDQESLLFAIRKAQRSHAQQQQKQREIDSRRAERIENAPPPLSEVPPPGAGDMPLDLEDAAPFLETQDTAMQEYDVLRILLRYGGADLELPLEAEAGHEVEFEKVGVQAYVLESLCEDRHIRFQHRVYGKMWTLFQTAYLEGRSIDTSLLLRHPDPDISATSAEMMSEPYELHDWSRHELIPKSEEQKMTAMVDGALNQLRSKTIQRLIRETQASIPSVQNDPEALEETLKRIQVLNRMKARINESFGTVILSR